MATALSEVNSQEVISYIEEQPRVWVSVPKLAKVFNVRPADVVEALRPYFGDVVIMTETPESVQYVSTRKQYRAKASLVEQVGAVLRGRL